jgi:hypothetical protein
MGVIVETIAFISGSAIDVLPIAAFLFAFQYVVIGGAMPNGRQIAVGFAFVVVGLGLFLLGLEQSLFPLGRLMAEQLTNPEFLRGSDIAGMAFATQDRRGSRSARRRQPAVRVRSGTGGRWLA